MSKAIRVIDLLNKIANGEEVPKKIQHKNHILEYNSDLESYIYIHWPETGWSVANIYLNDEVEIIEEQEEIDIQEIEDIKDVFIENSTCGEDVKYLARKYNEILKWAKQLDKKIKEER